jgi:hypothetical protein
LKKDPDIDYTVMSDEEWEEEPEGENLSVSPTTELAATAHLQNVKKAQLAFSDLQFAAARACFKAPLAWLFH